MLVMVLTFGFVAAGCASTPAPEGPPVAQGLTLEEALGKYAAPEQQDWGGGKIAYVWLLDPQKFDAFKAELDAGGEFSQIDAWEETRDWWQGRLFVRWAQEPDGKYLLQLCKADNSVSAYRYEKKKSSTPKLQESLGKYLVPQEQDWDGETVYVYFLDPLKFDHFKVELDAGNAYYEADSWDYQRDWDQGKTFARWAVRSDGTFELDLGKKDNSTFGYRYKTPPKIGDTWDEEWDEGMITLTYLGFEAPDGFILEREGEGRGEYKGWYTFYYHEWDTKCYVYYPASGRHGVQYGEGIE